MKGLGIQFREKAQAQYLDAAQFPVLLSPLFSATAVWGPHCLDRCPPDTANITHSELNSHPTQTSPANTFSFQIFLHHRVTTSTYQPLGCLCQWRGSHPWWVLRFSFTLYTRPFKKPAPVKLVSGLLSALPPTGSNCSPPDVHIPVPINHLFTATFASHHESHVSPRVQFPNTHQSMSFPFLEDTKGLSDSNLCPIAPCSCYHEATRSFLTLKHKGCSAERSVSVLFLCVQEHAWHCLQPTALRPLQIDGFSHHLFF